MPTNYIVSEPTPSNNTFIRSGRGGAGNTYRTSQAQKKPIIAQTTTATLSARASQAKRRFFSGIGGAGNAHEASERPAACMGDEMVRRAAARDEATVGHCGIGGAGNVYKRKGSVVEVEDDARSEASSSGSIAKAKLWSFGRN